MGELIIFLAGEMLGDSAFFLSKYPEADEVPLKKKEFRYYWPMPLLSVVISIMALGSCGAVRHILEILWEKWMSVERGTDLRELIQRVWNCFINISYITSMWLYMFWYRFYRKKAEDICVSIGRRYCERKRTPLDIYVPDGFSGGYVLAERWQNVRDCVKWLILINMILLAILHNEDVGMPISKITGMKSEELIPVAGITVLFEVYYFLGGEVFRRWTWHLRKWKKKKPEAEMDLTYLGQRFQSAGLYDGNSARIELKKHEFKMRWEGREYMERYSTVEDRKVQYFYTYLKNRVTQQYYHIHCIDAAVRLLQGENIFIATPFYRDIGVCIFFPAYMSLLRNEKVLIMAEDNGNLEEIAAWVKGGIEEIRDLADLWSVDVLESMADNTDVGIMAFQDIYRSQNLEWQKTFFNRVSYVIILEASDFLLGGQDAVVSWAQKMGKGVSRCTWLLSDRNAESMVDLFSHLLNTEFMYVSATPYYAGEVATAYWDAENEPMKTWFPVQRYMGVESRIVEIAASENIQPVVWYGEECMPVYDLKWVMGQYYDVYRNRTNGKPFQSQLDDRVIYGVSGNGNQIQREQFLIVEDGSFNLYEAGRQYSTRAEDKIFINIISPKYMMRDFMKQNGDIMNADPKWIGQFAPEYVNSRRNIVLRLVSRLLEGSVKKADIHAMLARDEDRGDKGDTGPLVIKALVEEVLGKRDFDVNITCRSQYSELTGRMEPEFYYEIASEEIRREMNGYFCQACYIDEEGEKKHISKMMLAGHLDQKYQVGQYVVFNGKYYEIVGKTMVGYERSLLVKRASEQIAGRKYYRQNRGYRMQDIFFQDKSIKASTAKEIYVQHNMAARRFCADIDAYTFGYVEMDSWNRIRGGRKVFWVKEDSQKNEERKYLYKEILEIELKYDESRMPFLPVLLAALFSEIFSTLYPQYYHLLSVAVDRKYYQQILQQAAASGDYDQEALEASLYYVLANMQGGQANCFYILEDSREDMGLLRSIERNFRRILDILQKYLIWSETERDEYFEFI